VVNRIIMNKSLALFVAVLLVLVDVFFLEKNQASFVSYNDLKWVSSPGCENSTLTDVDSGSEGLKLTNTSISCQTEGFDLNSKIFRFYISSAEPTRPVVLEHYDFKLKNLESGFEQKLETPPSVGFGWFPIYVDLSKNLSENLTNSKVIFEVLKKTESLSPGILIRDRLEFVDELPVSLDSNFKSLIKSNFLRLLIQLIVFSLVVFVFSGLSNIYFFLTLFILTISIHFKWTPYFYFDEWHIFQRFSEKSFFEAINYTHNEHYLPLFFLFYYFEAKILGDFYPLYLLVSCFLISYAGYVLNELLQELDFKKTTSRFLSIIFCVSSLNAEIAQWSLEQCISLSAITGLWAIIFVLRYFKNKNFKNLIYSSFCLLISPFFFGGGFTYLPIVWLFSFLFVFFKSKDILSKDYLLKAFVLTAVFSLVPFSLYSKYKDTSTGHRVDEESFFEEKVKLTNYFFQGTGFGSILRPLGFYPLLSIRSPQEVIQEATGVNFSKISPRKFVILSSLFGFGLIASIYLFFLRRRYLKANDVMFHFFSGMGFLSMFFILLALGRWKLGENQSLSLRYQFQALPGLLIAIAPFIEYLISKQLSILYRVISLGTLLIWVSIQLCALEDFRYFQFNGDLDRIYIQSAAESINKDGQIIIENPTLLPVHIPSITPGRGMPELVKTYYWLKSDK
jgi:hypothetical protein